MVIQKIIILQKTLESIIWTKQFTRFLRTFYYEFDKKYLFCYLDGQKLQFARFTLVPFVAVENLFEIVWVCIFLRPFVIL